MTYVYKYNALFVNAHIVQVSASLWYGDRCVLIQKWERGREVERERERETETEGAESICVWSLASIKLHMWINSTLSAL
jgi:hypothetical protein